MNTRTLLDYRKEELIFEIRTLNTNNYLLQQKVEEKDKEIDRLNNIINELEKWLIDKQDLTCGCEITVDYLYAYENCLDKLKELKENNK